MDPRRQACSSSRQGQALVEFALILPVFLLILMGIFDLSRAVYASSTINNAAREAGRRAIVDQTCQNVIGVATKHAVALGSVSISVTWLAPDGSVVAACPSSPTGNSVSDIANVKVTYVFTAATPLISQILGPITMGGETKFAIEATCVDPTPGDLTDGKCPAGG
jgi:Flp pilus assembly protein TadG